MIRMRTISLSLFAMLAMSAIGAVGATSASAFTLLLSEPAAQLVLAGQKGNHVFTVEEKAVECTTVKFHGATTALSQTLIEVSPTYTGCTAFGFINSTVHVNGCKYLLHISGLTDINCPTGKDIQILVANGSGCTILVLPQTGLEKTTFTNALGANGRMAVQVGIAITNIAVHSNGKGLGCPSAAATKGEYTGTSVAEGDSGDLLVH